MEKVFSLPTQRTATYKAARIVQQCLRAGLLDEIAINLVPVLLEDGVQLFDHLGATPIELESTRVIEAPGVKHLMFCVVK